MLFNILSCVLLGASPATISPKSPILSNADSMVTSDSTGAAYGFSRMYFNKNGWLDSGRISDKNSQVMFSFSARYTVSKDTVVQFYYYDGSPSTETSRYICNNAGIPQKQYHYMGDTLDAIHTYYYNQSSNLTKDDVTYPQNFMSSYDSTVFTYNSNGRLVSGMTYYKDYGWDYYKYETDAQGRIVKDTSFKTNSMTKIQETAVYFYLKNSIVYQLINSPKRNYFRTGRNGTMLFEDLAAFTGLRVFDARGTLCKTMRPADFCVPNKTIDPSKAYFIEVHSNTGKFVARQMQVR